MMSNFVCTNPGMRLDKFLSKEMSVSRAHAQKLIADAVVFVNGSGMKASYSLKERDKVVVNEVKVEEVVFEGEDIDLDIIYKCDDFLVINKAAGMVVHLGEAGGHMTGTVANAVVKYVDKGVGEDLRPGIVHRLDKETSGLMLIARTVEAYEYFVGLFKKREIKKTYLALVKGKLEHEEGVIDSPIGRDVKSRKKMGLTGDGKAAVTRYLVDKVYAVDAKKNFSLLSIGLETGRTHQIRVHMAAIDHAVVGDGVYGVREVNKWFREELGLERQFLHAHLLEFKDLQGVSHKIKAPLAEELQSVLDSLS